MGRSDLTAGINKRRFKGAPQAASCFMPQLSILKSLYAVNPGRNRDFTILAPAFWSILSLFTANLLKICIENFLFNSSQALSGNSVKLVMNFEIRNGSN